MKDAASTLGDPQTPVDDSDTPSQVDGRYRVEKLLGRGGLAIVYQVHDTVLATDRALKRLIPHPDASHQRRNVELFEREFHTLAQFAHPRAVAVYDYGIDAGQPYYTMDLLDGGDLYALAPLEWRKVCAMARDVCSALSLLHSRRLVYRDMSPRNVRCTNDGQAKLMDFGAVTPMGPSKQFVGTAAFCAPESVELQPLDARTDLYSLGATLYYMLSARHPYPARDFRQLRELWRAPTSRPSELVPGIPEALDDLIMSLLQLDPALRPASAAEVMERLNGIAELSIDEHLLVSQAYLTTPTLVGRDPQLARIDAALAQALRGQGAAIVIRSAAGLGRSRLLDACTLSGKLAGAIVLRGDADDAHAGNYGVVRALGMQLLERLPEVALAAARSNIATLGHVLPELLARSEGATSASIADPAEFRPRVQAALREWLLQVASQKPLLVAIDDVQRIDEPSAALIAVLARSAARHALLIVATSDHEAERSQALRLLAQTSVVLELSRLQAAEVSALLASVFGEVPNLDLVSERVHALAAGNPRDVMRLAQHLVDKRLIRYQAGAWSLPDHIDPNELPSSMAQAMVDKIAALSPAARGLAQALALTSGRHFSFEECLILCGHCPAGRLIQIQDELVTANVIKLRAEHCELAQQSWASVLRSGLAAQSEWPLQRQMAEVFEKRGDLFRYAQHLLRSDRAEHGLDALLEHAIASLGQTDPSSDAFVELVESLPSDWMECYDQAIELCERLGRPSSQAFQLRSRMAGLVSVAGTADTTHLSRLLAQLERDSGLAAYAELDALADPETRLKRSFELTQQRYDECNARDRVLDPFSALRQLARALIQVSAVTVTTRNLAFFRSTPSLAPFVALSPALWVVHQMQQAASCRCTGRSEEARGLFLAILQRTSQPDRAGLDESHHRHGTFGVRYSTGLLEAAMGLESSLAWAEQIESNPLYQVNAWTIRMLHHLWQGETRAAKRCRRKAAVLQVQNTRRQFFEGSHISLELAAHAAASDLVEVKQRIADIEPRARRYPGWLPILRYAQGEYHRLRGDYASALEELGASLSATPSLGHEMWAYAADSHIKVLSRLGRDAEAIAHGTHHWRVLEAAGVYVEKYMLGSSLAVAYARTGELAPAVAHADAALAGLAALGTRGLSLATAHSARALIAQLAQDEEGAKHHVALSAQAFGPEANPKIVAKYAGVLTPTATQQRAARAGSLAAIIAAATERFRTLPERAQYCLEQLAQSTGASAGFVFSAHGAGDAAPIAQFGACELPVEFLRLVRELLARNADDAKTKTHVESASQELLGTIQPMPAWIASTGKLYYPVLLPNFPDAPSVLALAVLVTQPDQPLVPPTEPTFEQSEVSIASRHYDRGGSQ